jgi:hypothetical protein
MTLDVCSTVRAVLFPRDPVGGLLGTCVEGRPRYRKCSQSISKRVLRGLQCFSSPDVTRRNDPQQSKTSTGRLLRICWPLYAGEGGALSVRGRFQGATQEAN